MSRSWPVRLCCQVFVLVVILVGTTGAAAWAVFGDVATAGPVQFSTNEVAPVTGLRCEPESLTSVRLVWDAATGNSGYRVELPSGDSVDLSSSQTSYAVDTEGDYLVRVVEGSWTSQPVKITVNRRLLGLGVTC